MECLGTLSIHDKELPLLNADLKDGWQAPIVRYLREKVEPTSMEEAKNLKYKALHYVLIDDVLYKQGHSLPFLRCLNREEFDYMLREYVVTILQVTR